MHKTFLFTLLTLLGLALAGCSIGAGQVRGSGNVTTEQRDVGAFTAVDVSGIGEVVINQGNTESLTVETDDNIQRLVLSEVRDGTLYLDMQPKTSLSNIPRLLFTVTVRDLKHITLSGAGKISVRAFNSDQLTIDNSGVGALTASGTVREQFVTLSGVGGYDGTALASERATVTVSGIGDAMVNVRDRLDATVSGVGSIEYSGNPEVHTQVSGVGEVRQRTP